MKIKNDIVSVGTASNVGTAIFQVDSKSKGFLFPRMTTTEINNISNPADGLTVYNTTIHHLCFYDLGETHWKKVNASNM